MSDDIMQAFYTISREFARLDIKDPVVVIPDRMDGYRIADRLRASTEHMTVTAYGADAPQQVSIGGAVFNEVTVTGIKIRWPAQQMALRDGGSAWV